MFVPFETIAPSSRVWIFQSMRKFTSSEMAVLTDFLQSFTENWAAHGQPLRSSFDIRFDQFIILAADESFNSASGCSIDESVRAIKEIENRLGAVLFDRQSVAFMDNDSVFLISLADLKQKYVEGIWNEATPTFNNLVSFRNQLDSEWIVPAVNTWLKRYAPGRKVTT
jgi:hypothetical protein